MSFRDDPRITNGMYPLGVSHSGGDFDIKGPSTGACMAIVSDSGLSHFSSGLPGHAVTISPVGEIRSCHRGQLSGAIHNGSQEFVIQKTCAHLLPKSHTREAGFWQNYGIAPNSYRLISLFVIKPIPKKLDLPTHLSKHRRPFTHVALSPV